MAQLVKYMGVADVRVIEKGDDFNGQLRDGLSTTLRWDKDNKWVIDVSDANLSTEEVELLLEEPDFKDVTELKRIPSNDHQKTFLGHKERALEENPVAAEVASGADHDADGSSGDAASDAAAAPDASTDATPATPTRATGATTKGRTRP